MSKAIIVGDIHLADKAPSSRRGSYAEEILDKIRWISAYALELGVSLVLAGDVFHIKAPSKNSHRLVQATHDALQGVRTFVVPGNHDLSHDRLDSLAKQPLGALARMEGVSLLMGYDPELPGIMGIPYLTEFDSDGEMVDYLRPWGEAIQNWYSTIEYEPEGSTYNDLIVTHIPMFPPGEEPKGLYNYIDAEEWAQFWSHDGPTNTYYGHIHDCHGVFTVEGHTFCNQGALSRGSLHEATINRKPAVTLWDGEQFTRIEVPHKAPEEVYLFDEAERKKLNKASAEEFNSIVGTITLPRLTLEAIRDTIRKEASTPLVLKMAETALEEAQ